MNAVDLRASPKLQTWDFAVRERKLLERLDVSGRLLRALQDWSSLRAFAEAFYFVRAGFVRVNFALGARCPTHEAFWGGIARNLWEELGAGTTPSHNELYRRFLVSTRAGPESSLIAPPFAEEFDRRWLVWVQEEPLADALAALAIYESLDSPDYEALTAGLEPTWGGYTDLEFFHVHAEARHLDLFDELVAHMGAGDLQNSAKRAGDFVISTQEMMWAGLLDHLESAQVATA